MPIISPILPNNGETADAPDVNIPFNAILALLNGGIDGDNLNPAASYQLNNITATTAVITDTVSEKTAAAGVTVDGVLLKDSQVSVDVINEKTAATGVTIDGVKLKDAQVQTNTIAEKDTNNGVTIDGLLIKDSKLATAASVPMSSLEYTLLDGVSNSDFRWDLSADDGVLGVTLENPFVGYKSFSHNLGYTPKVDAVFNWKSSGVDPLTVQKSIPHVHFSDIGHYYNGEPQDITVSITHVNSTEIWVLVVIHGALGLSYALTNPAMTFRFYCYKYPNT